MPSTYRSPFVCSGSLPDVASPVSVRVYVSHPSDTAALMKPIPAPRKLCFSHYVLGQKEISAPTLLSPSEQSQVGPGAEVLLSRNQQQQVPLCPTRMKTKCWFGSTSGSFPRAVELMLHHAPSQQAAPPAAWTLPLPVKALRAAGVVE